MPTLDQAQAAFSEALLDASLAAPGDVKRPFAAGTDGAQTKRFDVYRNNVTITAIEALGDTFPAVRTLVGEAFFSGAARIYFQQTPMRSPLLFQYGSTFGDFLDGFAPARSVPYLGDVARLEFNRLQAYHAADAAAVPITALASVPEEAVEGLRFTPHPSASLIRSRFPIVSLWGASTGLISSDEVDMNRPEDALTVRPGLEVDTRALPSGGGAFLAALLAGETLAAAAAAGGAADPKFDLSAHLTGLFSAGTFVDVVNDSPAKP